MTKSFKGAASLVVSVLALIAMFAVGCVNKEDQEPLTLTAISPTTGVPSGGNTLTLQGTGFHDGMTVFMGDKPCTGVVIGSAETATCAVPKADLGKVDVRVVGEDGMTEAKLEQAYEYICDPNAPSMYAVWANDGGDKVTRDELRAGCDPLFVKNSVWDGAKIQVWGAKNETVAFNLVIEAPNAALNNVAVSFDDLAGPNGAHIRGTTTSGNGVFNYVNRNIELFHVRYLQIKGLSKVAYSTDDERHIPKRLRRPLVDASVGSATGTWTDRPDHDKFYPDIAVPMELVNQFNIAAHSNQSVWADIFVPKNAQAGTYTGTVHVTSGGNVVADVPVELKVRNITLPDEPTSKTMMYVEYEEVSKRYIGVPSPDGDAVNGPKLNSILDKHFQMAHRHKVSLIDANRGYELGYTASAPRPAWIPRLNGSLFTAANGYDGPGINVGNGVYSIGTYATWNWSTDVDTRPDGQLTTQQLADREAAKQAMWSNTNAWEQWFISNSPETEHFLFLLEANNMNDVAKTELWSQWMKQNTGVGQSLMSWATMPLPTAVTNAPSLDGVASWIQVGDTQTWQNAMNTMLANPDKVVYSANGFRPSSGTTATEDDGVALRELAWGNYKKSIHRWFNWHATYYNDYHGGRGNTNVFETAQTIGVAPTADPVVGQTSAFYGNGHGVMFYPGTDTVFPAVSLGVDGPIASLRLKHLRRGVQDVDYLALAKLKNSSKTQAIIDRMVPKALWEYGVSNASDPTWVRSDISWSTNPDDWEQARKELADIIEGINQ